MKHTDIPDFRELLLQNNVKVIQEICDEEHPAVLAEWLSALETAEIWGIVRLLPREQQAEIVCHFVDEIQTNVVLSLERKDAANLLTGMSSDDRADLFRRLDESQREAIYPALAKAEREDIRRLTAYAEGTAGASMSSDYVVLRKNMTAAQALAQIRLEAPKKETIYYAYVVDEMRKLIGFVSLKDLIMERPEASIESFMHKEVIYAQATDDQEPAARKIQKYDLIALPVVNEEDVLVGIITHDDAIDIITQEQQEDIEKLMAIGGSHKAGAYLKTSSWIHFKNRSVWIVGLAALGLVSGLIIHSFEDYLTHLIILALYMPMVADTGGNTGGQSASVVVRALALGEIKTTDALKVLFKEFKIGLMLSSILGVLAFGKVLLLSQGTLIPEKFSLWNISFAISIALSVQVITATLIGATLPMLAAKVKWDPAVVASPALTTIVDITGLLIYFGTAKLIIGI